MSFLLDFLLCPVVMFLDAVYGVLHRAKTPTIAMYQKIARLSLLGSIAVVATMPLFLIVRPAIGIKPPLALGVALLFVFVVFGKLCDDQTEDKDIDVSEERG